MHKKFGMLFVVSLMAITLLLLVGNTLAISPQGAGSITSGFMTEYPIQVTNGNPQNIIVESAGSPASVWFTMPDANAVGNLVVTSTVDFQFTIFDSNDGITIDSAPYDLVHDSQRNLIWFTEKNGNQLGAINISTGQITETAVINNESPNNIAISDDGNIWFTQPEANFVTRFSPEAPTIDAFTVFTYTNNIGTPIDGHPTKISIEDNDSIWVTAPNENQIAKLKPSTEAYTVAPVADFGSPAVPPSDIFILGSTPWVASPTNDRIGRYIPQTLAGFQWFPLTSNNSGVDSIHITTSNGSTYYLWYTEPNNGRVGRITLNSSFKIISTNLHSLTQENSEPTAIVVDSQDVAWIANNGGATIGQWVAPYNYNSYLPTILNLE